MKANFFGKILTVMLALAIIAPAGLRAQSLKGNKKVVKEERTIQSFNQLSVGGAFDVFFTQSDKISLVVEADENLMSRIETEVNGDVLRISSNRIKNAKELNIYLSAPEIKRIKISGAATIESENTITGESLKIDASGASEARLDLEVDDLETDASGAAHVRLAGRAENHDVEASGAADVKAADLVTSTTNAEASGAASIRINATKKVTSSKSGAGSISVSGNPESISSNDSRNYHYNYDFDDVDSWTRGDTTIVEVGGLRVEVIDGDSTKVSVGNSKLVVDDNGHVTWKRNRVQKFKGHWAGFDLGVNGFVDKDFNINVPDAYDYLDLKYEKSIDVNLNFFEQNVNLINNKFGLVTGLGLRWNNYRFTDNVILSPDSSSIYGYYDNTRDWRKSKMVVNYLTLPILLEFQTNRFSNKSSFHITAGVVTGWRFATHTKMLYFDNGRQKPKVRDDFHLRPFRFDATARIGWGVINLYATYSLNSLFKDGQGPELYPFAIGITLVNL